MDLNEQAQRSLDSVLESSPTTIGQSVVVDSDVAVLARQMWLQGFQAGMETTHALAEQAFAKLEAELS